jgi:hypothetical protein
MGTAHDDDSAQQLGVDASSLAEHIVRICLAFGSMPSTAYLVAGYFLLGLEREKERNKS